MRAAIQLIIFGGTSSASGSSGSASSLLDGETDGLGIDFTRADASVRLMLMNSSVLTEYNPKTYLTNATTSPKYLYKSDGSRGRTDHNFMQYSDDASSGVGNTSGVTVTTNTTADPDGAMVADTVTISAGSNYHYKNQVAAAGTLTGETYCASVWLKAAAPLSIPLRIGGTSSYVVVADVTTAWQQFYVSGANSDGAEIEFGFDNRGLAGGDGLAHTVYACRWQYNVGSTPVGYMSTSGTSAAVALPQDFDPTTHDPVGLRIEPTRVNVLLNSGTPATQTRSLAADTYTVSVEGAGSITLSGGPTGVATEGNPITFTLGGTTSVTFTKAGSLNWMQCETGTTATSRIPTYAAQATRNEDRVSIATSAFAYSATAGTVFALYEPLKVGGNGYVWELYADSSNRTQHSFASLCNFGNVQGGSNDAAIDFGTPQLGITAQASCAYAVNSFAASLDGDIVGTDTSVGLPSAASALTIGNSGLTNVAMHGLIKKIAYVPRRVSNANLPTWRYTADDGPFDVFLIAGQSNAYFASPLVSTIDISGGDVFQWGRPDPGEDNYTNISAPIVVGNEPLLHEARGDGYIGFAVAMARDYYAPNQLTGGRKVLLVPCALGGTGFDTDHWNPGDALYEKAIARSNAAIASRAGNQLIAVLWMQGENEAGFGTVYTKSQYEVALDTMIADMRARLTGGTSVPVIVGGMQPGWVADGAVATRLAIKAALSETPGRVANTGYADPESPTTITADIIDYATDIHYRATAQREFAERWYDALVPLL
jgi:hypothetical protein